MKERALNRKPVVTFLCGEWAIGLDCRASRAAHTSATSFSVLEIRRTTNDVFVDVTGNAAVAKIELFKDSKHVYTGYLSLLKFGDGWLITDKVYFRHGDT